MKLGTGRALNGVISGFGGDDFFEAKAFVVPITLEDGVHLVVDLCWNLIPLAPEGILPRIVEVGGFFWWTTEG